MQTYSVSNKSTWEKQQIPTCETVELESFKLLLQNDIKGHQIINIADISS